MTPTSTRPSIRSACLYTDGAARGNPGPAAIGIVLTTAEGKEIEAFGEMIGEATNNEAEYRALLRGLERASFHHFDALVIKTDSELVAYQLNGRYRVRAENLKRLVAAVRGALKRFSHVTIDPIPRERNRRADWLANRALDNSS